MAKWKFRALGFKYMPELPEVQTTINGLKTKVLNRTFFDIWADASKLIKRPAKFEDFKKALQGKKILDIKRFGKNIIFDLSDGYSLLAHQKMTGHFLYGKWEKVNGVWKSISEGAIKNDPMNKFIHLIFFLDNGFQLALSDLRKFAKVELWKTEDLLKSQEISSLGIDALDPGLDLGRLTEILKSKKGKIKQVLMDQSIVAGVGNIYADEILFVSKIHPLRIVNGLSLVEIKKIYQNMKSILTKAIELGGTSISDYRDVSGEKGGYGDLRKVYRKEKQPCPACSEPIQRIKIGQRSSHFCPKCQT